MKIAIAHYHMRPGGVTSVIKNTCAALQHRGQVETQIVTDRLGYCVGPDAPDGETLAAELLRAGPDAQLWHFHNPTLGKHRTLPDALGALAKSGVPLLLQIHDFAEDERPANLRVTDHAKTLYPPAHYATVNRRDRDILIRAGLAPERAHLLPNAVALDPAPPAPPRNDRRLIFYPVRGIPRKNLGEIALMAAASNDTDFAIAAAPENPAWRREFDDWHAFCAELALPVEFDVVDPDAPGKSFDDWYAAADAIVTTSVAEGFGFAFLESFAKGRPLSGRDLPEITADFRARGLRFGSLYRAVHVPPDRGEFSQLSDEQQREFIRGIRTDPARAEEIEIVGAGNSMRLPEWMAAHLGGSADEIESNRAAIAEHYSPDRYAQRLERLYRRVIADRPTKVEIDRDKIRDIFRNRRTIRVIRELSAPLDPEPTGVSPKLPPLSGVRAVLFDVYGTLFVSGAGDSPPDDLAEEIARSHERSKAAGETFPEVDIRAIWRAVWDGPQVSDRVIEARAAEFECGANPVWPMPQLAETLRQLSGSQLALGIISNAQFFTPLLFEALVDSDLERLGFDPDLCLWSYLEGCAKPSPALFDRAAARLAERGITASETLFVGNDMLKDVAAAAAAGFRTALFAGCARSLRWREGNPRVENVAPDLIITDLAQLTEALGITTREAR